MATIPDPAGAPPAGGHPPTSPPPADSSRRRKRQIAALILVLIIVAVLLALLRCHRPVAAGPFDYFLSKADALGRRADRILAFVRSDVHTLPYRGDVKGPLAALWESAASPEEKVALANALLAHATSPRTVGLDDVAADRDRNADNGAPICRLSIVHRLVTADGTRETPIFAGPIGTLVGFAHSIEASDPDRTTVTLRGPAGTAQTVSRAGAIAEEIVFTAERPGGKPLTVVRELWHQANRVGPTGTKAGDRHDFVVLPCRVGAYVREKEELLLKQRGMDAAPFARNYLALLDYAVESDKALAKLEAYKKVRAEFELPRILILSQIQTPTEPGFAIDLRLNRTAFEGARLAAYVAAEMRSFVESGLEHAFLMQWTGCASTSTFGIFCQLRDNFPDNQDRRLAAMVAALEAFAEHGGPDGKVVFRARPPSGKDAAGLPAVTVTREGKGLRVRGGPVNADFARKLTQTDVHLPYDPTGQIDAVFDSLTDAALAVEVTLTAADVRPAVAPAYVLDTRIDCGTEPLVAPHARFHLVWGDGEMRTDQRITVEECSSGLDFSWRVQDGPRPAAGMRTVSAEALAGATRHNPWYRSGANTQDDVTSFCLSQKVLAELKAGRPVTLTLEGRYTEKQDADQDRRPVEWTGAISPAGTGRGRVMINGKEEDIRFVKADLHGTTVGILDDPLFPVGMADRLVDVWTSIRGRVVDEEGVGIAGAEVAVESGFESVATETWPDGSFRLPPPARGGYGKLPLKVTLRGVELGHPEVDLTNPGRSVVTVTVPRGRKQMMFIGPDEREVLDALPVSDQVKRHARVDLAAGNMVVIPNQMVESAPGRQTIGYYAFDARSGNIVGVTEDGLNGSTDSLVYNELANLLGEAVKNMKRPESPLAYVHMYRGANTAAWTYCSYRLEGMEHEEAVVAVVLSMDYWQKATNIMENFGEAAGNIPFSNDGDLNSAIGGKLQEKLTEMMSEVAPGVDDDWAKMAFKFGYLSTCLGLLKQLEGS